MFHWVESEKLMFKMLKILSLPFTNTDLRILHNNYYPNVFFLLNLKKYVYTVQCRSLYWLLFLTKFMKKLINSNAILFKMSSHLNNFPIWKFFFSTEKIFEEIDFFFKSFDDRKSNFPPINRSKWVCQNTLIFKILWYIIHSNNNNNTRVKPKFSLF